MASERGHRRGDWAARVIPGTHAKTENQLSIFNENMSRFPLFWKITTDEGRNGVCCRFSDIRLRLLFDFFTRIIFSVNDRMVIAILNKVGLFSFCHSFYRNSGRNCVVRERWGLKVDVVTGVERGRLRWFGRLERTNERRLKKQIYIANVGDEVGKRSP
ncbi:hypothetical protein EVAR_13742_1 [Eumeta japonica]|uniref:Uncharacterized protein n=1 Tax=Eumeta variegata TaxID=151549 RepID=A0A4C1UBG8_EUMVA|nr:hypothetical protein EVAR_13742_1 [Eumeta japonica]